MIISLPLHQLRFSEIRARPPATSPGILEGGGLPSPTLRQLRPESSTHDSPGNPPVEETGGIPPSPVSMGDLEEAQKIEEAARDQAPRFAHCPQEIRPPPCFECGFLADKGKCLNFSVKGARGVSTLPPPTSEAPSLPRVAFAVGIREGRLDL